MCRWWHSSLTHPHDPCAGGGTLLHLFGPPDPGNQFLLQEQEQCQQGDLIFDPLLQYSGNIILLFFHCIHGFRFSGIKNGVGFEGESWRTNLCMLPVLLNQRTFSNLIYQRRLNSKRGPVHKLLHPTGCST